MNILLWVLQVVLAFWNVTGGIFTFVNYEQLKSPLATDLPKAIWIALSIFQILFAVGLVWPKFTRIAAIYLVFNSFLGLILFAKYAGFPGLLWGVVPALLEAFVAYGRSVKKPN